MGRKLKPAWSFRPVNKWGGARPADLDQLFAESTIGEIGWRNGFTDPSYLARPRPHRLPMRLDR
jgi:hypothetical protein